MSDYNIIIPIKEYEMLKKVYEERNKPLEYPYSEVIDYVRILNEPPRIKYYKCKEDLIQDFKKEVDNLHKLIDGLHAENALLKILERQIATAPTFLGYKYFKP